MLEIEYRITYGKVIVILRRSIYEYVAQSACNIGMEIDLPYLTVGNITQCIFVFILGRNLQLGALGTGAIQEQAGRIRDSSAVNDQSVIVVTLIQRIGITGPIPFGILCHGIVDTVYLQEHLMGSRGQDTPSYYTL